MYLKDKKVDQNEIQLVFVKLGNFLKIFTSISYFMKISTNVSTKYVFSQKCSHPLLLSWRNIYLWAELLHFRPIRAELSILCKYILPCFRPYFISSNELKCKKGSNHSVFHSKQDFIKRDTINIVGYGYPTIIPCENLMISIVCNDLHCFQQ